MLPAPSWNLRLPSESCQVPAEPGTNTDAGPSQPCVSQGWGEEVRMRIQVWRPNLTKDLQGVLKPCLFQVPAQNYPSAKP